MAKENVASRALTISAAPDELCDQLDLSLEQSTIAINKDFFENPGQFAVIEQFKVPFKRWLKGYGLTGALADAVAARLPSYFVFALNHEWRRRPEAYAPIKEAVDTPFTAAAEREQAWTYYNAWLQKQIEEPLLNEAFGLRQIYVPVRAYYEKKGAKDDLSTVARAREETATRTVVEAEAELDQWIDRADRNDAVRVMSGGPGCGKSSFTKMYAARAISKSSIRVLYVPLHQFDPKADLIGGVGEFVKYAGLLPHNPLDPESEESRLLILVDGLDELAMQGRVGAEVARGFVEEVIRSVARFNFQKTRLQVLITGREIIVQANVGQLRKEREILHVLPYYVTDEEKKEYHDPQGLLKLDQRDLWWQKYGAATGRPYEGVPDELKRRDLDDITAQPLLNFLVALSYVRGKLDFSTQINLNEIYEDLLEAVHERAYASGGTLPGIRNIKRNDFIRILEEVGLATWRGDGRTTTISEIQSQCQTAGLSKLLEAFREGAEAGVAQPLTAFYFRQQGYRREGEPSFEFTHKSFGEYLTARRFIRAVERIQGERDRRDESPDSGSGESECLKHWAELFRGSPRITRDPYRFMSNEVRLRKEDQASRWQLTLCSLIGFMLQRGMPMEQLVPPLTYQAESRVAISAEAALLATLYACASVTQRLSEIQWGDSTAAGAWISSLQGQRIYASNVLALECLGLTSLKGCTLDMRDFYSANMSGSDLSGARLGFANLEFSDLEGADLVNAGLAYANLQGANLQRANLKNANLEGAFLEDANLQSAKLDGANLKHANLTNADLTGASIKSAIFEGTRLEGVKGLDIEAAKRVELQDRETE